MMDKPIEDSFEREMENPFNENAINLQFSEPHFPQPERLMHKQLSLDSSN